MPAKNNPVVPLPCLDCVVSDVCTRRVDVLRLVAPLLDKSSGPLSEISHKAGQLDIVPGETPDAYRTRVQEFLTPDPHVVPVGLIKDPTQAEAMVAAYFGTAGGCRRHTPH